MIHVKENLDLGQFVDWVWNLKKERDELKAKNGALIDRANYWKQRAKSAEGHLCSSDTKAAAMALQARTEFAGEEWEKLSGCQRAKLLTAAAIVIGTVNARRDLREPKHKCEEVDHG